MYLKSQTTKFANLWLEGGGELTASLSNFPIKFNFELYFINMYQTFSIYIIFFFRQNIVCLDILWLHYLFLKDFICEWERVHIGGGAEGKGQANSALSTEPNVGFDLLTLRSWPEQKSRVRCSTDWGTQAPILIVF